MPSHCKILLKLEHFEISRSLYKAHDSLVPIYIWQTKFCMKVEVHLNYLTRNFGES